MFPQTIDMAATCQEKRSLLLPTQAIEPLDPKKTTAATETKIEDEDLVSRGTGRRETDLHSQNQTEKEVHTGTLGDTAIDHRMMILTIAERDLDMTIEIVSVNSTTESDPDPLGTKEAGTETDSQWMTGLAIVHLIDALSTVVVLPMAEEGTDPPTGHHLMIVVLPMAETETDLLTGHHLMIVVLLMAEAGKDPGIGCP